MITLLAQQATQSSDKWWLAFAVPAGVVFGALIAGLVSLRTWRKTPYEKLEKLIGVLKDWPDDLPGRGTVYQAVELTLGEIRQADRLDEVPLPGGASTEADQELIDRLVRHRFQRVQRRLLRLTVACVVLLFIVAVVSFALPIDNEQRFAIIAAFLSLAITARVAYDTTRQDPPVQELSWREVLRTLFPFRR